MKVIPETRRAHKVWYLRFFFIDYVKVLFDTIYRLLFDVIYRLLFDVIHRLRSSKLWQLGMEV